MKEEEKEKAAAKDVSLNAAVAFLNLIWVTKTKMFILDSEIAWAMQCIVSRRGSHKCVSSATFCRKPQASTGSRIDWPTDTGLIQSLSFQDTLNKCKWFVNRSNMRARLIILCNKYILHKTKKVVFLL